ncbi:MAG: anaerobic glycerol-3-phosphate dehydrogenase subunit C [Chloroflexi bacterium]|nr:anaerobic glycerol-3-phosphate dehydrogenase subunit C [Chloroflexota bacterium]
MSTPTPVLQWDAMHKRLKTDTKKCYYCGICEPLCPVFTPLFKLLAREYEENGAPIRREEFEPMMDLCYYCKLCLPACGIGVDFPRLALDYKIMRVKERGQTLQNTILMSQETIGKLSSPVAPISNWALSNGLNRRLMEAVVGIDRRRTMPKIASETFPRWMKHHKKKPGTSGRKIALFSGCFTDYYDPAVGIAAIQVLERNGVDIVYPPQRCCGIPMLTEGSLDKALQNFEYNTSVLAPLVKEGYTIVVLDGPCAMTFRQEVPQFLKTVDARNVGFRVRDINQYLMELVKRNELDTNFNPVEGAIAYHASCAAKLQRIETAGFELLKLIPGLTIERVDKGCCGFDGSFGFKKQSYEIANQVGAELFAWVKSTGASEAITDCPLCEVQIADGARVRTAHPIEVLARAYGF